MNQIPWVIVLVKGNLGDPKGQRNFDLRKVWTHDLRDRFTDDIPTELQGQYGSKSRVIEVVSRSISESVIDVGVQRRSTRETEMIKYV